MLVNYLPVEQVINPASGMVSLAVLIFLSLSGYYYMRAAEKGRTFPVRRIRAFEAIEEAVARSVEMGRPIHYTIGYGSIRTAHAPQYTAGLGVLTHVARLAGKYGARLIATHGVPEAIASIEEIVRDGYFSEGRPELYNPVDNARYLTDVQFAYASAAQAVILRENAGANIVIGPFWAESLILSEAGTMVGAFQIGGTARDVQIPFFVLVCDYAFIGEEIFAAGAMASGDAATLASIRGQDVGKLLSIILIVLGLILLPLGVRLATYLLW
jgi:hypothetical protein